MRAFVFATVLALAASACAARDAVPNDSRATAQAAQRAEDERHNEEMRQLTIRKNEERQREKEQQDAANLAAMDVALVEDDESSKAWKAIDADACALVAQDAACQAVDDFIRNYPTSSKVTEARAVAERGSAVRQKAYDLEAEARLKRLEAKNKERAKARAADEKHWAEEAKKTKR